MLKVAGSIAHFVKVLDTKTGKEELYTASDLINAIAQGVVIHGCKYSKKGVMVSYAGNSPIEFEAEVWKPVTLVDKKRSDGSYVYEVSNLGRIRVSSFFDHNHKCKPPRLLHPYLNKYKWYRVRFTVDSKAVYYDLHTLVAREFLPGYSAGLTAVHIDGNSEDCGVHNLKWVQLNEYKKLRQARRRSISTLGKPVRQYDLFGKLIAEHPSVVSAARNLGIWKANIDSCCARHYGFVSYKGFIWRYASDDEFHGVDDAVAAGLIRTVRQYTLDGNFVCEYTGLKEIRQKLGINTNSITYCGRRVYKSVFGFIWRYSDDDEFAERPENIRTRAEWRKTCNAQG